MMPCFLKHFAIKYYSVYSTPEENFSCLDSTTCSFDKYMYWHFCPNSYQDYGKMCDITGLGISATKPSNRLGNLKYTRKPLHGRFSRCIMKPIMIFKR